MDVKKGDSILVEKKGSQIWLNVVKTTDDFIIGCSYDEEPIEVNITEIKDVFNEKETKRKIHEILFGDNK